MSDNIESQRGNRKEGGGSRSKPVPLPYQPGSNPGQEEEKSVHEVYEAIAPHFSQTRHKPWPLIVKFLNSLPPHSLGLDSGAGNGKYLPTARNAGVEMIAMDRSLGLLQIAQSQGEFGLSSDPSVSTSSTISSSAKGKERAIGECVRGDLSSLGWRQGVFDFAISIAAIHHLSTPERRRQSVKALLHPLFHDSKPPYSRFLIYVWAYEQGSIMSKRKMGAPGQMPSSSTLPTVQPLSVPQVNQTGQPGDPIIDEPSDNKLSEEEAKVQDVLVPWVLQSKQEKKEKQKNAQKSNGDIIVTSNSNDEKRSTARGHQGDSGKSAVEGEKEEDKVFHRYYHLFVKEELENLVKTAAEEEGYRILEKESEKDENEAEEELMSNVGRIRLSSKEDDVPEMGRGQRESEKWLRIKGVGWEMDNWWLEGEVGLKAT